MSHSQAQLFAVNNSAEEREENYPWLIRRSTEERNHGYTDFADAIAAIAVEFNPQTFEKLTREELLELRLKYHSTKEKILAEDSPQMANRQAEFYKKLIERIEKRINILPYSKDGDTYGYVPPLISFRRPL